MNLGRYVVNKVNIYLIYTLAQSQNQSSFEIDQSLSNEYGIVKSVDRVNQDKIKNMRNKMSQNKTYKSKNYHKYFIVFNYARF